MDIEISTLNFMKAALEVEEAAMAFFENPAMVSFGMGVSEGFLQEKREEIAKLKQQIKDMEEADAVQE